MLQEIIKRANAGNNASMEELLIRMKPLLSKCAKSIYYYEYEDAMQELSISLIQAVKGMKTFNSEPQCLYYMKQAVTHTMLWLIRKSSVRRDMEIFTSDFVNEFMDKDNDKIQDTIFYCDLNEYLKSVGAIQSQILKMIMEGLSDKEIAKQLNKSRQHINAYKKKIFLSLQTRG